MCLLTFFDWCCQLHYSCLCLFRQIFLVADAKELFSSPPRALVTFFVQRDKLELTFWLSCSMHDVIKVPLMEWWAAVTVVSIPLQPVLLM